MRCVTSVNYLANAQKSRAFERLAFIEKQKLTERLDSCRHIFKAAFETNSLTVSLSIFFK